MVTWPLLVIFMAATFLLKTVRILPSMRTTRKAPTDTQMIARSQDISLYSRVLNYKPELWEDAAYKQRKFFDWGGWLAARPMEELPYWRVVMHRERDGGYGDSRRALAQRISNRRVQGLRSHRVAPNAGHSGALEISNFQSTG